MKIKDQYGVVHRTSKAIVCAIVIFLLLLGRYYETILFDAIAVIVWFFGVNFIAYVIEGVLHLKHKHTKL